MRPKISVITPFLNAESFLQDAITSVQTQTFSEWELLLVDDGSTDQSPSIASLAAAKDARIKVLRRRPELAGGAAAARNIGLRAAAGEFVAFLDADDVYESRMLEVYLDALKGASRSRDGVRTHPMVEPGEPRSRLDSIDGPPSGADASAAVASSLDHRASDGGSALHLCRTHSQVGNRRSRWL